MFSKWGGRKGGLSVGENSSRVVGGQFWSYEPGGERAISGSMVATDPDVSDNERGSQRTYKIACLSLNFDYSSRSNPMSTLPSLRNHSSSLSPCCYDRSAHHPSMARKCPAEIEGWQRHTQHCLTSFKSYSHRPSMKNLYSCLPSGNSKIVTKSLSLERERAGWESPVRERITTFSPWE